MADAPYAHARGARTIIASVALAAVIVIAAGALLLSAPLGAVHDAAAADDEDGSSQYGGFVSFKKEVFSWTDKVHITVVAPDHNFDRRAIDTIGGDEHSPLNVHTRKASLDRYKLAETGPNTGIFTGEVILIGFDHDADGNAATGVNGYDNPMRETGGRGPAGGYLKADRDDAVTVSFEYTDGHSVVGTALIQWNVGSIQWSETSYVTSESGIVRVVDPDMNLNPEGINSIEIDVWSESDPVGITLVVTENSESSGIFEGTVTFTATDQSSGHRLRVAEGDIIVASYEDNTLPKPHNVRDNLDVETRSQIGATIDALDRVSVSGPRIIDGLGTDVGNAISAGQQVQVTSMLTNEQKRDQPFIYIVMVRDEGDRAVALSWIRGHLQPGQSLDAATSWLPGEPGTYNVDAFVWESITKPNALAPPTQTTVTVN